MCKDDICLGKSKEEPCTSTQECKPNLICKESICSTADKGCLCSEKSIECHITQRCVNGKCIDIGSKEIGDSANDPLVCKSFYISGDKCAVGRKLINEGNTLEERMVCPTNKRCKHMIENKEQEDNCVKAANETEICEPGILNVDTDAVFFAYKR